MKYLFILLVLFGCAKSNVSPSDITGHWVFTSTRVTGDFTLVRYQTEYKVLAGGTFTIDGVGYTTAEMTEPSMLNNSTTIGLQTAIANNSAHNVIFAATPSSDWNTMTATNVRINQNTQITDKFTVFRK